MQAYTEQCEREFVERQVRLAKVKPPETRNICGRLIASPGLTESAKHVQIANNGPVILLPHNWQAMSGDELRAELDRVEATQPRNIINKSDKAMLDLLDMRPDKLDKSEDDAKTME